MEGLVSVHFLSANFFKFMAANLPYPIRDLGGSGSVYKAIKLTLFMTNLILTQCSNRSITIIKYNICSILKKNYRQFAI